MRLSLALIASAFTLPITDRLVESAGIECETSTATVDANSRGMLAGAYDVAEMSISTYLQAISRGVDFVALPIFVARRFVQPSAYAAERAGLLRPEDAAGRAVLIPQYWLTSSLWHRAVLQHEHDVPPEAVKWITMSEERTDATWPANVSVTRSNARLDLHQDVRGSRMIADGAADIIMFPRAFRDQTGVTNLYADPLQTSLDYHARTGVYPLIHALVIPGALLREHPQLASALVALFENAKAIAYARREIVEIESPLHGLSFGAAAEYFGGDPYPFGVQANLATLQAALSYAAEQGLTARRLDVEEAFPEPVTRATRHRSR